MAVSQLTVFGAGLIGGSLCLAARAANFADRIVAIEQSPQPRRVDVADVWVNSTDAPAVKAALADSELTVLCTPVRTIISLLPEVLDASAGWVTDCGSTKSAILAAASDHPGRARFVGGHPMAGRPEGGLEHADPELFVGRRWLLCPAGATPEALTAVLALVKMSGAAAVELEAEAHDRSVAFTSHVPQVVASALSVLVQEVGAGPAAGPGFESATRVAGGPEPMWKDIFETNGPEIGKALEQLVRRLEALGLALNQNDASTALRLLKQARTLRNR